MERRLAVVGLLLVASAALVGAGAAADATSANGPATPAAVPEAALATADGPATGPTDAGSLTTGYDPGTVGVADDGTGERPAAVGPTAGNALPAGTATIGLQRELALAPDRPGEVRFSVDVTVPDGVVSLRLELPDSVTAVTATEGFERVGPGQYEWTGGPDPSLSARVAANRSASGSRIGDGSGYTFVDAGDWALVRVPAAAVGWSERVGTGASVVRETAVAGAGATGGEIAYLGAVERYERTAADQRFELAVPRRADLAAAPGEVLDSMASAAGDLRVGDRDENVFVVAAPSAGVSWGVRGIQTGPDDAWVGAREPLNSADNVWLHEYVHTRQAFATTEDARWLTEGSADYLAALLTLQQGRVDYTAFRDQLALGTDRAHRDAVLSEPSTWEGRGSNYRKGALVLGELDRRLRLSSDGSRALTTVLSTLNRRDDPVSAAAFVDLVAAGDDDLATATERFTTTSAVPDTWSLDAHRAAFGTDPAAIELGALSATLSGPYRNRSVVIAEGSPRRLAERPVVGETLTLTTTLRNDGGTAGDYDVVLTVDGEAVARRAGRLAPGEAATLTFAVNVTAGSRTLRVGDRRLVVDGVAPATASVERVGVDPTAVDPGASATLSATVAAPDDRPAARTLRFRVGDRVVGERTVRLDAGERATVTVAASAPEPGTYEVGVVDGPTTTLTVEGERTATTETGTDPADGSPAPGPVATLLAVCLAFGLLARRQ